MNLKQCAPAEVLAYWPAINEWIVSALNHGGVFLVAEQVWSALLLGQMTLWLAVDEQEQVHACAVTQVIQYPKIRACNYIVVGGREMDSWFHLITGIEDHAKSAGCECMESISRPGMAKKAREHGYLPLVSILRKAL
jgi:hypothetical protein